MNHFKKFTKSDGLAVQYGQLKVWRSKLSPECFAALEKWTYEKNLELREEDDGYAVVRGNDLDCFIRNWSAQDQKTRALQVIVLDGRISAWLQANDLQALNQCREALGMNSI